MDWIKIIKDLQATGLRQAQIGAHIGRSQVWVAEIIGGKYADLKWSDGQALIALHKKVTRQKKLRTS